MYISKEMFDKAVKMFSDIFEYVMEDDIFVAHCQTEMFSSTAGPNGGCGGRAMTNYTVTSFQMGHLRLLFCGAQHKFITADTTSSFNDFSWRRTKENEKDETVDWGIYTHMKNQNDR